MALVKTYHQCLVSLYLGWAGKGEIMLSVIEGKNDIFPAWWNLTFPFLTQDGLCE